MHFSDISTFGYVFMFTYPLPIECTISKICCRDTLSCSTEFHAPKIAAAIPNNSSFSACCDTVICWIASLNIGCDRINWLILEQEGKYSDVVYELISEGTVDTELLGFE